MIKPTTKQIASNENTNAPQLQFSSYEQGKTYKNDGTLIDFVTDGKSLYVCAVEMAVTSENTIEQEIELHGNFLKVISQGEQGAQGRPGDDGVPGATPNLTFRFDGKQLVISENGQRKAVSPDLAGPSWRPVLNGRSINWTLSKDTTAPQPLNIDDITVPERPLLLRTDSDNTRRLDEESGPARFIQWKYEGEEEWRNLISISELMNLALAGVSFWREEDGWHFGHKEVISATYSSDASGNQIISNVELGNVLFDAGTIPASIDGDALAAAIQELKDRLDNLNVDDLGDLTDVFATKEWVRSDFQPKGDYLTQSAADNRYVRGVKSILSNGVTTSLEGSGNVQFKTIGGQSIVGTGDIEVGGPGTNPPVDLTGYATEQWVNNQGFLTQHQSLSGLVRTINNNAPDQNGNVRINIAENPICYLKIESGLLWKRAYNDAGWVEVGIIGGNGGGLTEEQVRSIVNSAISGLDGQYVTVVTYNDAIRTINERLAALEGGTVLVYRTFTAYKWSVDTPSNPGQVSWNAATNTLPVLTNGWNDHPIDRDLDTPSDAKLWMCTITLPSNGTVSNEWSNPINLTANPGVDGNGVEFIYKLYADITAFNIDRINVPSDTEPLDSVGHWYDHPQGISENETIEAASMRTYDGATGTWSHYCVPFIWSMWGEDGMDGDGVEYIFYVAASDVVTVDPQTLKATLNASQWRTQIPTEYMTEQQFEDFSNTYHYQIDDWCPDASIRSGYQMPDYNWTDNPTDVSILKPYEFVCIRKYNGSTKQWGRFSEPKLWGYYGTTTIETTIYGATNNKPYTCYAFYRTNDNIASYTVSYDFSAFGNSQTTYNDLTQAQKDLYYTNPQNYIKTQNGNTVVNIIWSDTIPPGTEQLWLISNHIGDEVDNTDTGWTSPQKWGDQAGFQVEYAVSSTETDKVYNRQQGYTLPNLGININNTYRYITDDPSRDTDGDGIDESLWREDVYNNGMGIWGDENDVIEPDYMACCFQRSNGVWTDWQLARIKGESGPVGPVGPAGPQGENGSDGADGSTVEFVYCRTKGIKPGVHASLGKYPDNSTEFTHLKDDWLPKIDGIAINELDQVDGEYWTDHPKGVTEEWPYEYVTIRKSTLSNKKRYWDNYTSGKSNVSIWSKYGVDGKDGDGVEYIFTRSQNDTLVYDENLQDLSRLDITSAEYQNKEREFVPTGWTDDPQGVNSLLRYEWVSSRKYDGFHEEWGQFSAPAIWARYSTDGAPGPKGDDGKSFTTRTSFTVNDSDYVCNGQNSLGTILETLRTTLSPAPSTGDAVMIQRENSYGIVNATEIWCWTGEVSDGFTLATDCDLDNGLVHGWRKSGFLTAGSSYIHQKFANETDIRVTSLNEAEVQTNEGAIWLSLTLTHQDIGFTKRGEFPGKYVGMYADNIEDDSDDISRYTWAKWSGDDGFGMEQIFTTASTPVRPYLTVSGQNISTNVTKLYIPSRSVYYTNTNDIAEHYYDYDAVPMEINNVTMWYDRPQQTSKLKKVCYCSVRKLDVETLREWTEPVEWNRYTRDGVDGKFKEYVYHTYNDGVTPRLGTNLMQNQGYVKSGNSYISSVDGNAVEDFLPSDGTVNGHWTDNPQGVSASVPYEWVSERKITYDIDNNPSWGPFSTPTIWSHFGENGKDGDGLEYVFFAFNEEEYLGLKWWETSDGYIPSTHDLEEQPIIDANNRTYLDDEFLPVLWYNTKENVADDKIALDDNPGASLQYPYIYYSTRTEENGSWADVEFTPLKEWYLERYPVDVVVRQVVSVDCDHEGNVLTNTTLSYPILMTYDGETVNYPRYWDININDNDTESTNSITVNNKQYLYVGALKRSECTIADGSVMYRWKNNNNYLYTDTMYPVSNSTAYDENGVGYTINNVSCTSAIRVVGSNLTINTANLPWNNNNQVVVTLTGHFTNMYDKYAYKQITIIKNNSGTPGEPGDSYILDVNYKTINADNLPTDVIARVLHNGDLDSGWTITYILYDGEVSGDTGTYSSPGLNLSANNRIGQFQNGFSKLTFTASKSGHSDLTITIPTVHNGSNGVPYFFRGEWQPNNTYYHNSQRIDIVKRTVNDVATYYICSVNHNGSSNFTTDLNNGYWSTFEGNFENIATTFLFAEGGYIEDLRVRSTQIDGTLKAAEIETSDLGNGKITINAGGSQWDGDCAIKGYAPNSSEEGIIISGKALPEELFTVTGTRNLNMASFPVAAIVLSGSGEYPETTISQGTPDYDENVIPGEYGNMYQFSSSTFTLSNAKDLRVMPSAQMPNITRWCVRSGTDELRPVDHPDYYGLELPTLDLIVVDQNEQYWGCLVKYTFDGGSWTPSYQQPFHVEAGTYELALVPNGVGSTAINDRTDSRWKAPYLSDTTKTWSAWDNENPINLLVEISANMTFNVQEGNGYGKTGTTIAPNGILVYFGPNAYLQFVNINGAVTAKWIVGNTTLISAQTTL